MSPVNCDSGLDREDYWIETLLTSYPYGLNEREEKICYEHRYGSNLRCFFIVFFREKVLFYIFAKHCFQFLKEPLPSSRQKSAHCRGNINFDNFKDMESIFNCIHNYITDHIKNASYHIQMLLINTVKKYLLKIASEVVLNGPFIKTDLIKIQYCFFILDNIDTNKCNKYLNILAQWNLINKKNNDNNATVTYQLGKTIRNKVLDYKEAVNSLYADEDVSSYLNTGQCGCADSFFVILIINI